MFYGVPEGREGDLLRAVQTVAGIYEGQFYCNDMIICLWRNMSFRQDEKFMTSFLSSAVTDQEKSLLWRLHTLAWATRQALRVEGDFVECGVFKGFCSEVLFKYCDFGDLPRQAYLYDTFAGLPEKTSTEEERRGWDYSEYDPEILYREVCTKFSRYKNVNVIRGIVPDSFDEAAPEKIAFLHIDMNSEKAEILALERLFDRVVRGGVIVFDDFGWSCNISQMKSELAFMNQRGYCVLEIPTGQGIVIK